MKKIMTTWILILSLAVLSTAQKLPSYDEVLDLLEIEKTIDNYLNYWIQQDAANTSSVIHTHFVSQTIQSEKHSSGTILSREEFMQSAPESSIKWYIDETIYSNGYAKFSVTLFESNQKHSYLLTLDRIDGRWAITSHDFENYK